MNDDALCDDGMGDDDDAIGRRGLAPDDDPLADAQPVLATTPLVTGRSALVPWRPPRARSASRIKGSLPPATAPWR
jgi:hypothetical protein